ncbi:hypothetical protein ABZP36_030120 [Zizania latifolia]
MACVVIINDELELPFEEILDYRKHVEVPIPAPKDGEVLIKMEAVGINAIDWKLQKGMLRPFLPKKFPFITVTFCTRKGRHGRIPTMYWRAEIQHLPIPAVGFMSPATITTLSDLGSAGLSGPLIPQLGGLSYLQYLELYGNELNGSIPTTLGKLSNMISLDLQDNLLTGTIPDSLGTISTLQLLYANYVHKIFRLLNGNSLTGIVPMEFADQH